MTAIRSASAPEGKFVQIANAAAQDRRLSLAARGILLFVLSLPPDRHFTAEWLETQVPEGRRAVRSALRELEACGYYRRTRTSSGGNWKWDQVISDAPVIDADVIPLARRGAPAKPPVPRSGRATVYRGIKMRSRLEASYAAHLDATAGPDNWEYEPTCFAGPDGQWLPDFGIDEPDGRAYVELKPISLRESPAEAIDKILRQMSVALLSEPQCTLRLQFWDWEANAGEAITLGAGGQRTGEPG